MTYNKTIRFQPVTPPKPNSSTSTVKRTWDTPINSYSPQRREVSPINAGYEAKPKLSQVPEVHLSMKALQQIWAWTDIADEEWSGLGYIREDFSGLTPKIIIENVYLVKQVNSAASTKMDSKDVNRLITDLLVADKDPKWLRCWIHSHGSGSVFWSNTDEKTCQIYADEGYMVSIVVNKNRHLIARLNIYEPFRLSIDTLPVVYQYTDQQTINNLAEEYNKLATEDPWYLCSSTWKRSSEMYESEWADAEPEDSLDKRLGDKRYQEMTEDEWVTYCQKEFPTSESYMCEVYPKDEDSLDLSPSHRISIDDENLPCFGIQWEGDSNACDECILENGCIAEMQDESRLDNQFNLTAKGKLDWENITWNTQSHNTTDRKV